MRRLAAITLLAAITFATNSQAQSPNSPVGFTAQETLSLEELLRNPSISEVRWADTAASGSLSVVDQPSPWYAGLSLSSAYPERCLTVQRRHSAQRWAEFATYCSSEGHMRQIAGIFIWPSF